MFAEISRVLAKRGNAATARAVVAIVTLRQRFGTPAGCAADATDPPVDHRLSWRRYAFLVNVSAAVIWAAVVTLFLQFVTHLPAAVFAVSFGAAVVILLRLAAARRHSRPVIGRIFAGWATVPLAITIGSAAQVFGWTGFVPTLLLGWICAVLATGLWSDSSALVCAAVAGSTVWAYLNFLYDGPPWPGWAVLALGVGYVIRRRRSVPLLLTCTVSFVTQTEFLAYGALHPAHYPVTFDAAHLPLALAAWGAALAGWAATATWSAHRWVAAPAEAVHEVLIFGIYLAFTAPQAWRLVDTSFGNAAALPLGLGLFAIAAAMLGYRGSAGDWVRLALWFAAFVAVWLANRGFPPMLLAAVAGLLAVTMSGRWLADRRPDAVLAGALMVTAVGGLIRVTWPLPWLAQLAELGLTALVVGWAAISVRPRPNRADPPQRARRPASQLASAQVSQ